MALNQGEESFDKTDRSESDRWPQELRDPQSFPQDRRNLIDHYKYWEVEAIKADLDKRRHDFVAICENICYDFNISTVVRNANAFLAREVWVCGRKDFDKRGAVGTYHYQHMRHASDTREAIDQLRSQGYSIIAVDQTADAENLHGFDWPLKSAMIFGQEQIGVSPWALHEADHVVYIPQWGSTRSLNVGVASGVAMNSWAEQHGQTPPC